MAAWARDHTDSLAVVAAEASGGTNSLSSLLAANRHARPDQSAAERCHRDRHRLRKEGRQQPEDNQESTCKDEPLRLDAIEMAVESRRRRRQLPGISPPRLLVHVTNHLICGCRQGLDLSRRPRDHHRRFT